MYSKAEQTKKVRQKPKPSMRNTKPRKKKCKYCKEWFTPEREMQTTCTIEHAILYAKKDDVKSKAINKAKQLSRSQDKSIMAEKAQKVFNKFIRARDKEEKCISCDYDWKANGNMRQAHASHYMSVGKSKKLRFNEYNVNKSCSICNSQLSGNLAEYRIRLIDKIGLAKVEELENIAKESSPCKYTVEDYKKIISIYSKKIKDMI